MKACVVGYGMIDALGSNPDDCWNNLINDVDFHQPITNIFIPTKEVRCSTALFPEHTPGDPSLPRTLRYGIYAAEQALSMSRLPKSKNVATIFSSLTGGNSTFDRMITTGERTKPKTAIKLPIDALCSHISMQHGFMGINTAIYSACATGLVCIDYAIRLLDEYDYVIVGGSDAGVNGIDLDIFSSLRALGSKSRPFDNARDGFIMGEGAGCIILQSEEKAIAYGSTIHATITGVANASDAYDETAPSGAGARLCLSKLDLTDVDAVNAHGTGTPIGDRVEYDVVREFTNAPIYSNKGKIGHTFAAAGILETIYSILSIKHGVIPHTANCIDCDMDIVKTNIQQPVHKVLSNSFGFGGKCCSIIIEDYHV